MASFEGRDIISIRDFDKKEILSVLNAASDKLLKIDGKNPLDGKILATLFFEPSTRTRLSFETAMLRLGGKVIGFADSDVSSSKKGETLQDAVRVISGYSDCIVIRHHLDGAARLAAEVSENPVINGGDGANQHPTQTFQDLYTILKSKGRLEGLKVGFLGDLTYGRTVHSLVYALSHFDTDMFFISPESLKMSEEVIDELKEQDMNFKEGASLEEFLGDLDVLYVTRIQKERFPDVMDYERVRGTYRLDESILADSKPDLTIMHPLPRVDEISTSIDGHDQAMYFEQAMYGIPVRQALLGLIFGVI